MLGTNEDHSCGSILSWTRKRVLKRGKKTERKNEGTEIGERAEEKKKSERWGNSLYTALFLPWGRKKSKKGKREGEKKQEEGRKPLLWVGSALVR